MKRALTGDLIELSDLFRRAAEFKDQEAARKLVTLTREMGCLLTQYEPAMGDKARYNSNIVDEIGRRLIMMGRFAYYNDIETLVLPLHRDNPYSRVVEKAISQAERVVGSQVRFEFRTADYTQDLDAAGYIREEVKTFLDEGIRGLGAIDSELKYKWDSDARKGGQLDFDL